MISKSCDATDTHDLLRVPSLSTKWKWERWGLKLRVASIKQCQRWAFPVQRTLRAAGFSKSVQFRHKQPLMCEYFIYSLCVAVTVNEYVTALRPTHSYFFFHKKLTMLKGEAISYHMVVCCSCCNILAALIIDRPSALWRTVVVFCLGNTTSMCPVFM